MTETGESGSPKITETDIDAAIFASDLKQQFEMNKIALPPLYNPENKKFIGKSNLYSIYYDSYKCILCGMYRPGIMLMEQLIESTLREIIFVHDGVKNEKAFGELIFYSRNLKNKREGHQSSLLPKFFNKSLKRIKDNLGNPYSNLNYEAIFSDELIRGVKSEVGVSFKEIVRNTEIIQNKINNNEVTLPGIDKITDKVPGDMAEREKENLWAIIWAWEIYPLFEILVDEYLTEADYKRPVKKHDAN